MVWWSRWRRSGSRCGDSGTAGGSGCCSCSSSTTWQSSCGSTSRAGTGCSCCGRVFRRGLRRGVDPGPAQRDPKAAGVARWRWAGGGHCGFAARAARVCAAPAAVTARAAAGCASVPGWNCVAAEAQLSPAGAVRGSGRRGVGVRALGPAPGCAVQPAADHPRHARADHVGCTLSTADDPRDRSLRGHRQPVSETSPAACRPPAVTRHHLHRPAAVASRVSRNGQILESYPPSIFGLLAQAGTKTAAIVSAGVVESRFVKGLGFSRVP